MKHREEAMDLLRRYGAARQAVANLDLVIPLQKMPERQQFRRERNRLRRQITLVDRALSGLNPEERLILHRFFIAPVRGKVLLLCMELNLEQSTLYRHREKALAKFTAALFGP